MDDIAHTNAAVEPVELLVRQTCQERDRNPGQTHSLAPMVFAATTAHGAVLLDLKRNRYLGIGLDEVRALEYLVTDWPSRGAAASTLTPRTVPSATEVDLISSLERMDLLRAGTNHSSEVTSPNVRLDGDLVAIGDELSSPISVRIGHILTFSVALISALIGLHVIPIASTARRVHRRRIAAVSSGYIFDPRAATHFVCIFRRIRPFAFTASGHCMLHALTLVNFLARYKQFPMWILGVRVDPWAAHSWVQYDSFLLDTNPEKVCNFDPIVSL